MSQPHKPEFSLAKSTSIAIREAFRIFKESAFPDAKKNTLDYNTACLIEDMFRQEEELTIFTIEGAEIAYNEKKGLVIEKFMSMTERFFNKGLSFIDELIKIEKQDNNTAIIVINMLRNGVISEKIANEWFESNLLLKNNRHETIKKRKLRSELIFSKVKKRLAEEQSQFTKDFEEAIDRVIKVIIPESHDKIKAILNQHFLQEVGSIHNLN